MKVILFGATGMVGQGVLRECLLDARIDVVLAIGRSATGKQSPKLREISGADLYHLTILGDQLAGYDAAFFCLGVSSAGMSEADYRHVTFDLTVAVAQALAPVNPHMTFVYVSGAGTDSTEKGPSMWARVKGQTENALLRLPFKAAYMFRPGAIRPLHGVHSKTGWVRATYILLWPFIPLIQALAPNSTTTTEAVGRAMIRVSIEGAPERIVDTREINTLGRPPPKPG